MMLCCWKYENFTEQNTFKNTIQLGQLLILKTFPKWSLSFTYLKKTVRIVKILSFPVVYVPVFFGLRTAGRRVYAIDP